MKNLLLFSLITSSLFGMQPDLVLIQSLHKAKDHSFKMKDLSLKTKDNSSSHNDFNTYPAPKTCINHSSVFIPQKLGAVELYHSKKGFYIKQDEKKQLIKKYFTDKVLRDISKDQLKHFLEGGYLSLNQMENGEYSLQAIGTFFGMLPTP